MAVSFRTGHVEASPSAGKGRLGWGLLAFPCPQVVRLGGSARREWLGGRVSGGLAATEESHWKVLNMSGPLGCQLEELDVTPLNSIDGHWGDREEKGYGLAKTIFLPLRADVAPSLTLQLLPSHLSAWFAAALQNR